MDPGIIRDVVIGGVLAALVLPLWRDFRSLGERVARLQGWLEYDRSSTTDQGEDSRRRYDHGR